MQAALEWRLGNFEQMLSPAQASFAFALEVSDRRDIAIARFYVGLALARHGANYDQAFSLLEESFMELRALNEKFWLAYFDPYLSELLAAQLRRKLPDRFVRSLELARKVGERLVLADVLSHYATWLFTIHRLDEARQRAEEADRLRQRLGVDRPGEHSFVLAAIAWLEGDTQRARSLYMQIKERWSLLGENAWRSVCLSQLGMLAMEEGDLHQAQVYLEQALVISRQVGSQVYRAMRLIELGNLFYLRGNLEVFKQNAVEGLSLRNYLLEGHKVLILETILGSLYLDQPESVARILGSIDNSEAEIDLIPAEAIPILYCGRAEGHARKVLGVMAFGAAFSEGQKMSLDEALDLALKTVEEI
ncbi:MAG TPA: hypothetical protein VK897_05520 [Anaerolineales bacterium]|nr:hypothetical protein [Anaerolineales bacterium]